jgi:L-malate glycosyltransferase
MGGLVKIGIMCHSTYGGSSRIAINSAFELSRRGHTLHLFSRAHSPFLLRAPTTLSIHTIGGGYDGMEHPSYLYADWPDAELNRMVKLIISVIEEEKLDIFHVHYALPFAFIAQAVKQELGTKAPPMILTLHGTDVNVLGSGNRKAALLADALLCFDALTTVSVSHAELFARLYSGRARPEIIPNFVDLSRFLPKPPRITGVRPVLLHLSNFREVKDPCGVVEVFERVRRNTDAVLWFVGDGDTMGRVKTLVAEKELTEHTKFYGLLPDVAPILIQADLLVMSSVHESFCLAALEAMACGVPVLATATGGLPEVVIHGESGMLYPFGDYATAADLAIRLLSEPERYARISASAALRAQHFDQRRVVGRYETLYNQVKREGAKKR